MTTVVDALDAISSAGVKNLAPQTAVISYAKLHHGNGAEYPIGQLITEINLFEDIETLGVTGWLTMYDNVNLFQAGPIIGHELLYLKFESAGATEGGVPEFAVNYLEHPLAVFKVTEMSPATVGEGSSSTWLEYRLHFCSTEMLDNDRIRVSKTYQGTSSDIIKDIFTHDLRTKKPLEIEDTLDIHHFVSPNFHPYDVVSELTARAQAQPKESSSRRRGRKAQGAKSTLFKGRQSDFLCYETSTRSDKTGGFKLLPAIAKAEFPSLMFSLQNAQTTSGVSDSAGGISSGRSFGGGDDSGYKAVMLRSLNYVFTDLGDKYDSIRAGMWGGKHIRHNGVTKKYDTYISNYQNQLLHKRYSHMSDTPTMGTLRTISEWPEGHIRMSSASAQVDSNINRDTGRVDYPWDITPASASLIRTLQMMHLFGNHRIEMTLPGLSGLSVGELAFADLPDLGLGAGQPGLEGARQLWENRLDNVWLVTKVAHRITTGGENPSYLTKVELVNTMSSTARVLPTYDALGVVAGT